MIERTVCHFGLQGFVTQQEAFNFFGAVEMRAAVLDDIVYENDMESTAVPVRIYRKRAEVTDCVILSGTKWSRRI